MKVYTSNNSNNIINVIDCIWEKSTEHPFEAPLLLTPIAHQMDFGPQTRTKKNVQERNTNLNTVEDAQRYRRSFLQYTIASPRRPLGERHVIIAVVNCRYRYFHCSHNSLGQRNKNIHFTSCCSTWPVRDTEKVHVIITIVILYYCTATVQCTVS